MAGAGYKLFATGDVLTAAQVNTYLQEQTVMVFNDAAARTTALSGVLAEGMITYLKSDDTVYAYNGSAWVSVASTGDITEVTTAATSGLTGGATSGAVALRINTTAKGSIMAGSGASTLGELTVGTNGQYLQADSTTATGLKWASISAGGMTLISTTTLTGASVTLSSIPSTYTNLRLVVRNWRPVDTNKGFFIRFNADSTASRHATLTVLEASAQTFSGTSIDTGYATNSGTDNGIIVIDFPDYANTSTWKYAQIISFVSNETTTTNFNYRNRFGAYNQTSAVSSLQLFPESGNFNAGTALLYGVS